MAKGKFVQNKKGAKKLRRPARRAAGLKVDKHAIYRRSGRRVRAKIVRIKHSNGGAATRAYVVALAKRQQFKGWPIEFPEETPATRWATSS